MKPLESGAVEQAIYTWSTRNPNGGRGEGLGEYTSGLQRNQAGLAEFCADRLYVFGNRADAVAKNGEDCSVVGRVRFDGNAIGFRKILNAGRDGVGRRRSLVHLVLAPAEDLSVLDVMRLSESAWLDADDCPLDHLPVLGKRPVEIVRHEEPLVAQKCKSGSLECWADHVAMLRKLGAAGLELDDDPVEGVLSAFRLLPQFLWSYVELDGMCDASPRLTLPEDTIVVPQQSSESGLCAFRRSAGEFVTGAGPEGVSCRSLAALRKPVPPTVDRRPQADSVGRKDPDWLSGELARIASYEPASARALKLRQLLAEAPNRLLPSDLMRVDPFVWRSAASALSTRDDYEAVARCMRGSEERDLRDWWFRSREAASAYCVARLTADEFVGDRYYFSDLMYRRREWEVLLRHCVVTNFGIDFLRRVVGAGGLHDPALRAEMASLGDEHDEAIFRRVLPAAPAADVLEFLRESFDSYANWQGMDPVFAEAIELALRRRSGTLDFLKSLVLRGHD